MFIPPTLLQSGRFTIYFFPFGPNRKILTLLTRGSSDLTLPFHVLEIDIEEEKSKRSRRSVKSITFVGTSSALTLGHFR